MISIKILLLNLLNSYDLVNYIYELKLELEKEELMEIKYNYFVNIYKNINKIARTTKKKSHDITITNYDKYFCNYELWFDDEFDNRSYYTSNKILNNNLVYLNNYINNCNCLDEIKKYLVNSDIKLDNNKLKRKIKYMFNPNSKNEAKWPIVKNFPFKYCKECLNNMNCKLCTKHYINYKL